MSKKIGFGKFLTGVAIGAGLGVLLAPKSGKETREDLKRLMDEMLVKIDEIDMEEVKKEFLVKFEMLKIELQDLDKEKVLKLAKKQAKVVQNKAEELVEYAVKKGTPVLEKTADALRQKALVAAKEVVERLEKKEA